jgi:phospholipase/carboxylesterase
MTRIPASLSLAHQLRWPAAARESSGRHPALIALHGRGSDEADLLGLAPYLDERLLWVSVRGLLELDGGYEWYRLPSVGVPDQASFDAALAALGHFVDEALAAYPIDPRRLYLFGFSQGGMMAYALLLTRPQRVAGVIAHSSYLPRKTLETGRNLDLVGVRDKPCLILDTMLPVRWAREARDALTSAGTAVTYYEFPMGHQVSDRSLAAIDDWLNRQLGGE